MLTDASQHELKIAGSLISVLSKTRRQYITSINQTKRRKKERLFIVEGYKGVTDILKRRSFEPVWLVGNESFWHNKGEVLLKEYNFNNSPCFVANPTDLKQISSLATPPDFIGVFRMPEWSSDLVDSPLPPGLYLLLDGIQDPGNLGTIIRTCHWFGVYKIFASTDTVDIFNPKTIQSTMGSLGAVTINYVDLPSLVEINKDIPLIGLQLEGSDLFKADLPSSAFICMGSEGNGLSDTMQKLLKKSFTIPSFDPKNSPESLNVATATAITLSQFRRNL